MKHRAAAFSFAPTSTDEATGVTIMRAIGGERMCILDPFLLLDHAKIEATSPVVGFPRHPHRGIETLSVVINGEVGHKDSIGNEGVVGAGGTQWMTAGNGIFHEEMMIPGPEGGEFLQLWFSLPKDKKRVPAGYQGADAGQVPESASANATVRVICGAHGAVAGRFLEVAVSPTVLDIQIEPDMTFDLPTNAGEAAFVYLYRGSISIGEKVSIAPEITVLTDGDQVALTAGAAGARLLYCSAQPLNEPILQYRSLVMNTVEDMQESVEMIEKGTFAT